MTKKDFINAVAAKGEYTTKVEAEKAVNTVFDAITGALAAGEKIQVPGFGSFEVKERAARVGHNPRTGEEVQVAACKVPAFKAGKTLKEAVNA